MFASLRMIIVLMELKEQKEIAKYWDMNIQAILDIISSDIYKDGEQRIMFSHINHSLKAMYTRYMEPMITLAEKVQKLEGCDPWTKQMILGHFHIKRAWNLRSGKLSKDVSEEGKKGFMMHLDLAYTCLEEAWKLHPEDPESAVKLIQVAMGAGETPKGEDIRYWFNKAQMAQFDYEPAYSKLMYALLPKWGESYEQLLSFGSECLSSNRFDTIVPHQYLNAVKRICRDRSDYRIIRDPVVYENLNKMCQGYIEKASTSIRRKNYYKSILAAVNWRADRTDEASKIADALGKNISRKGLKELKVKSKDIRNH